MTWRAHSVWPSSTAPRRTAAAAAAEEEEEGATTQGLTRRSRLLSSTCLCAHSVLVYPYTLASSSTLAPWPLVTAVAQPPASSRNHVAFKWGNCRWFQGQNGWQLSCQGSEWPGPAWSTRPPRSRGWGAGARPLRWRGPVNNAASSTPRHPTRVRPSSVELHVTLWLVTRRACFTVPYATGGPQTPASPEGGSPHGGGGSPGDGNKVDGKEFFRQARARLSYENFSQFLQAAPYPEALPLPWFPVQLNSCNTGRH